MLRTLFAMLLFVHGLLHVLGFLKQWQLATVSQLSGKALISLSDETSKLLGLVWLLSCLGFLLAMVSCLLQRDWWLIVAAISVVLSQSLIIIYWSDAHAGTLVNVCIALVLVLAYSHDRFEKKADQEVRQLFKQPTDNQGVISLEMLSGLPAPVHQWLQESGVVGKERVHTVRLRQHGLMRTSPEGRWMSTEAEQYFGVDKPGFVWSAEVRMLPFLPLAGRDKYADGKGNMLIKALSLVPLVNASDAKTDQGTLLRFLGEMCWFPSAALSPYIHWRTIDATHAQATMSYKGVSATAVFAFDEQHRLTSVSANRYMGGGKDGKLEKWYIPVRNWKEMDGVVIPVKGDVIWRLPAGDFDYYQWEITDIDYNYPVVY